MTALYPHFHGRGYFKIWCIQFKTNSNKFNSVKKQSCYTNIWQGFWRPGDDLNTTHKHAWSNNAYINMTVLCIMNDIGFEDSIILLINKDSYRNQTMAKKGDEPWSRTPVVLRIEGIVIVLKCLVLQHIKRIGKK